MVNFMSFTTIKNKNSHLYFILLYHHKACILMKRRNLVPSSYSTPIATIQR